MNKITEIAFQMISAAGEAKNLVFEALENAKHGQFENAEKNMEEADDLLVDIHKLQFDLLSKEASDEGDLPFGFIMVHAQDHLMTTMLAKDLINEQISLYKMMLNRE